MRFPFPIARMLLVPVLECYSVKSIINKYTKVGQRRQCFLRLCIYTHTSKTQTDDICTCWRSREQQNIVYIYLLHLPVHNWFKTSMTKHDWGYQIFHLTVVYCSIYKPQNQNLFLRYFWDSFFSFPALISLLDKKLEEKKFLKLL